MCACVSLIALFATHVPAQTLNLGPPAPPTLPDDNAASRLQARLADEIEDHTTRLENARSEGDPDWTLAESLSIATRALGVRMLGGDATLAGAHSIRTMQAMTIADLAPSIDTLAHAYVDLAFQARAQKSNPATVAVAARAEAARAAINAFLRAATTDPSTPADIPGLPPTAPDLDRLLLGAFDELRPALGAIDATAPDIEPAWVFPPGVPVPPEDAVDAARTALDASNAFGSPERADLSRTLDTLGRAAQLPIHRREARTMARRVGEAIHAADVLSATEWLGDRRTEIGAVVAQGALKLLERTTREDALRTLEQVCRLGRIVENLGTLEARRVNTLAGRHAIATVFVRFLDADQSPGAPDGSLAHLLGALDRTLSVAADRPVLSPDYFEDPGVRRAWRLMVRNDEDTERHVLDALEEIVDEPRRLTSPDMISLLKKHRDGVADLRRVAKIPAWEAQLRTKPVRTAAPTPGQDDALVDNLAIEQSIRSGAADRLHALMLVLARDEVRARALVALADFVRHWTRFATLPSEMLLTRNNPAAVAVTGGRAPEVLAATRRDRQAWLLAWAAWKLKDAETPLKRLDAEARIGRAIEICVALSDPDRLDALNRWAGVELSRSGVGAVRRAAKDATEPMIDAMLAGDWTKVDALLERWDQSAATAKLLARLVEATERKDWPAQTGAAGLIAQLGSGVPVGAWLRGQRVELADLSRWVAELGVAVDRDDEPLQHQILAQLDRISGGILESLGPE